VVEGTPGQHASITLGLNSGDYWKGITFFNTDSLFTPSEIRGLDVAHFQQVDVYKPGVVFENCNFDHGNDHGMQIVTHTPDFPDTVRVANCTFSYCGEYGIFVDSSAATIRNTVVTNTSGRGIWLHYTNGAVEVTNCISASNGTDGLTLADFCSPKLVNDIFARNAYHGIEMTNNCNPDIRNSIVYRNSQYGIFVQLSSFPTVGYNDVFGHFIISGQDSIYRDYMPPGQIPHDATNLGVDPLFASDSDYHLASASPCRNAGDPDPAYNDPDGSANDMGAYGGPNGSNVGAGMRRAAGPLASK